MKQRKIVIILPAYNEAGVIADTLKQLPEEIDGNPVQIVVVNDGSKDDTAAVVRTFPHIHLINHILNSGAGGATRTGLAYARLHDFDVVATIDADGQHDPADLVNVVRDALDNKADLIIGSRLMMRQGMPWYRVIGNKGLNMITFALFGVLVTDSQSGLKAFSRKALLAINFNSTSYSFCSEIVWRARQQRLRILEVPIRAIYTEYSLAKGQRNMNGFSVVGHMLKQRFMEILNG